MEHEAGKRDEMQARQHLGQALIVASEAEKARGPGEVALDDSATRQTNASSTAFVRDRFTWSAYLLLGYGTFLQATLGPLAPFFQARFALSYGAIGLPTSAYAVGMLLMGLLGASIVRRYTITSWISLGVAGMAIGAFCLILVPTFALVVVCSFIMGIAGTLL